MYHYLRILRFSCGTLLLELDPIFCGKYTQVLPIDIATMTAVMNAVKIVCVTYTDDLSLEGNAYNDLKTGLQAKTVASNSRHLSNTKAGDIVMIRSSNHITFGIIQEQVGTSDAWSRHGGKSWKYNFRYLPITDILKMSPTFKQMVKDSESSSSWNLCHYCTCYLLY